MLSCGQVSKKYLDFIEFANMRQNDIYLVVICKNVSFILLINLSKYLLI